MKTITLSSLRSMLCWLALGLALPVGASAQGPPPQSGKPLRYILVLKAAASAQDEPDVAKAGGRVLGRSQSRQVIEIPLAALDGLSRHASVAYLALVDDGTPTDAPRYVLGPSGTASARVAADATAVAPNWDSGTYAYDGSGNITAVGSDSYRYDEAQRLKTATVSGVPSEYTYDSFGNLVARKIDSVSVPASTSPSSNHLDYATYDRAGNQLSDPGAGDQEYEYDAANLMIQRAAPVPRRYVYTADDERIGMETGSDEWEWTIRDFSGRVLSTYESFSTGELDYWIWQESHHYRGSTLTSGVKLEERVTGATAGRYFHTDHLGTPRLITNQSRQKIALHDYHPFGRELTRHNQEIVDWMYDSIEPMQFTGHERDYLASIDSNAHDYLDYMHARYYNPSVGRFLSVDPNVDIEKNASEPQRWNRYSYTTNSPMKYTDPDGRERRIMVFSFHTPSEMRMDMILNNTVSMSKGYDSGYSVDVRHSLTGQSMLRGLQDVDQSGTDIVVMNTHGGRPLSTETGGGPDRSRPFILGVGAIAKNLDGGRPQAIVLAGCGTMDSAQAVANATGVITFAVKSGAQAEASQVSRAGAVLANVYAATGNAQLAVAMANRIINQRHCPSSGGSCSEYPQFQYVQPEKK